MLCKFSDNECNWCNITIIGKNSKSKYPFYDKFTLPRVGSYALLTCLPLETPLPVRLACVLQIDPKSFFSSLFGLRQKHQTPIPSGLVKLRPSFITLRFSQTLCFLRWKHCFLTNQVVKTTEKKTLFFNMIWNGK